MKKILVVKKLNEISLSMPNDEHGKVRELYIKGASNEK